LSLKFRPTDPSDADAISRLMQQIFGIPSGHPGLRAAQMDWKYWQRHPKWEGSRSFVMERDGELVAHGSVVPLSLAWQDRRYRLFHMIDWAAKPDSPGAGRVLLRNAGKLCDGFFVAGGSDMTQKILPALGCRQSVSATMFALPVRPFVRLRDDSRSAKSVARFGRNLLWKMRARSIMPPGWNVRRVPREQLATAEFPTPHPRGAEAVFERTAEDIAYLMDCPVAPVECYVVEKNGVARGYFVLTVAIRQSRIAETWVDSREIGDWRALYLLAIREASARREIAEIVTVGSTPHESEALKQAGFQPRGEIALRFRLRDKSVPEIARYQMVDGDAAYLHDGSSSFWA